MRTILQNLQKSDCQVERQILFEILSRQTGEAAYSVGKQIELEDLSVDILNYILKGKASDIYSNEFIVERVFLLLKLRCSNINVVK